MANYNQMALLNNMMAGQQAQNALQQGQAGALSSLDNSYNAGVTQVNALVPQQGAALQRGYDAAAGSIAGAKDNSLAALGQGYNAASGAIQQGYNTARGDISGGVSAYDPYYQTGTNANTMYSNAMGLNGAAGNQAATNAFQASPGYQWAVDQASNNAMRRAGAMGMLGSGNTADALARLGSNLANQEYGNYLSRLQGLISNGMSAADARLRGGFAQGQLSDQYGQNAANLATGYGKDQAGIYDAYGTRGADLATGLGTNLANTYGHQADLLSGLATNRGNQEAGVYTNTAGNTANTLMQGSNISAGILDRQQQEQYAAQQKPWMLAGGVLGGLSSLGSGMLSNPSNKLF